MTRERKRLQRDPVGNLVPPEPMPTDTRELLDLMDEAFRVAIMGEPGTRAWERSKILFELIHSNFQLRSATDLGEAHKGLERATKALGMATWWLAVVTVFLGAVELLGFFHH
jgi:hypothetical protein